MKTQNLNLFIIDEDPLKIENLSEYLKNRFGSKLQISKFSSRKTALINIDTDTNIVVLDYVSDKENGNDVIKSIHTINPNTEVILLSVHDKIGMEIDNFRKRVIGPVNQNIIQWSPKRTLVYKIVSYPVRLISKEFGINKYIAMFLTTFFIMGICTMISLWLFR